MGAVFTVLLVMTLSLVVVRIAAVSLTLTGLSEQTAKFQARSAFTGAGFTTSESEKVVNHPVRRKVILWLMLLGNAGIVTGVASVMLSMVGPDDPTKWTGTLWARMLVLFIGCLILWRLAFSPYVDKWMSEVIAWGLKRWTNVDVRDYSALLHLADEYAVAELHVKSEDWLAGKLLSELQLSEEGVLVLGIERPNGTFIGAPRGNRRLDSGDLLILYGRQQLLVELDDRRTGLSGSLAHLDAVGQQRTVEQTEAIRDEDTPQEKSQS